MIVTHKNRRKTSPEIGDSIRGLRIVKLELDHVDVKNLRNMLSDDTKNLVEYLNTLSMCMVVPDPHSNLEPIDEENALLKRQGKNYLCMATFNRD